MGLTLIIANGSVVNLAEGFCSIDNQASTWNKECQDLWFAVRGAGSDFGVITSFKIRLYPEPTVRTALTVLSIEISNINEAGLAILKYFEAIPQNVSVTFYILDAYFKAYLLVLKFASSKLSAIQLDPLTTFSRKAGTWVHAVVEVSWLADGTEEDTWNTLKSLHTQFQSCKDSIVNSKQKLVDDERPFHGSMVVRPWVRSTGPWTVPSYDVVWGTNHAFGAASITIDKAYALNTLISILNSYNIYLHSHSNQRCSDCVLVLHRVGPGVRFPRNQSVDTSSSFHPARRNAYLWVELDCGHFHRSRSSWPECSSFIDEAQVDLDYVTSNSTNRFHYRNVPSVMTKDWKKMYYGDHHTVRLEKTKCIWDPYGLFSSHQQSLVCKYNLTEKDYDSVNNVSIKQNENSEL